MALFIRPHWEALIFMGSVTNAGSSADSVSQGSLAGLSFDQLCTFNITGGGQCPTQFIENDPNSIADDIFYFVEGAKFRKITNPTTPSQQFLSTEFTFPSSSTSNFIVSLDQSQVFYIRNGYLSCHPLTPAGTKSWCNDSNLGPTVGMTLIAGGPNQMTWKNSQTLFINNYQGEIYQYDVLQNP